MSAVVRNVFVLCGIIAIMQHIGTIYAHMKLTRISCRSSTLKFAKCRVEVFNRTTTAASIRLPLPEPVTGAFINVSVVKKASTWQKFLYEFKNLDCCKFVKSTNRNKVLTFLFSYLVKYSNLNHTCPYEGDLILHQFTISEEDRKILPIPAGEYGIRTSWFVNNKHIVHIDGYLSYTNYKEDW